MKKYGKVFFVIMIAICMCLMTQIGSDVVETVASSKPDEKKVIVIDPGHGGFDPGKVGINDALEKDINLSIAFKLKTALEGEGFTVILTRTDDVGLYSAGDSSKKSADMKNRVKIINDTAPVLAISVHQNSYTSPGIKGAQVFYHKNSNEAKVLAEVIQEQIKQELNDGNKRIAKSNDSYYMLRNTKCPTVIVECGFLSNKEEADLLIDDSYQNKMATAIKDGVVKYVKGA